MKYLAPLPLKQSYYVDIETQINAIFDAVIYDKIRIVLKARKLNLKINALSISALSEAIDSGKVWYLDGYFYGEFNTKVSKILKDLGATYLPKKQVWRIEMYLLPQPIQQVLIDVALKYQVFKNDLLHAIDRMDVDKAPPINYLPTIDAVQIDLAKTIASVGVAKPMSQKTREVLSTEWGQNLDLYIKNWMDDNILKLRNEVQSNTLSGYRAEALVDRLRFNYGSSKHKAKFLARQETSLLVSKLRENEYKEIGITRYKWSVAGGGEPDERVRELHKLLNGKIFNFDDPPASGTKGEKLNPGEPFGCRCIAIPIVDSLVGHNGGPDLGPDYSPV